MYECVCMKNGHGKHTLLFKNLLLTMSRKKGISEDLKQDTHPTMLIDRWLHHEHSLNVELIRPGQPQAPTLWSPKVNPNVNLMRE